MKMHRTELQVRDVLELYRNGMLKANPEYQRGAVWSLPQNKKLIDSVMRGYPLPLIYLHHIKKNVAGMQREDLEIIDGQQRINALFGFAENAFRLFDPKKDDREAKFPNFVKLQPCPWAGKDYEGLPVDLRDRFLETPLAVVQVQTDNEHEARDLFIRLQAGLPLNAQETRDAWPGHLTDFVLRIGGKPQIVRYPGHGFFQRILGMKPASDRGKTRHLVAQILTLYLARRENGPASFPDIGNLALNEMYYKYLDFDPNGEDAQRFVAILDRLEELLAAPGRPRLKGHDAIHLVLLADSLWDDYAPVWEDRLPEALDQFLKQLAGGKATRESLQPDEFWTQYGQWTRVNSDRGDTINRRHAFYADKMLHYLGEVPKKDPKRLFGELEREIIYFRDNRRCMICNGQVLWSDAAFHHIQKHSEGGPTTMTNGALLHRECHPVAHTTS
jgi:hypothetical protein